MDRRSVSLFGISTISDYLDICSEAVIEFEGHQASVLKGFAAILILNHVPDWLEHKLTPQQTKTLNLSDVTLGKRLRNEFERRNPDLYLVRQIANGFKHLRPVQSTERIDGYGAGPYGVGPFGMPYLLIDLGDERPSGERWDVGLSLCQRVVDFRRELTRDFH
jgi:hypothetical protein